MVPSTAGNLVSAIAAATQNSSNGDSLLELWQTDFLLVLDIFLVCMFSLECYRRARLERGWQSLMSEPPIKILFALSINYAARIFDRSWLLLRHYGMAADIYLSIIAVVALLLAIWSASCILRVFSNLTWGKRAWIWVFGLAFIGATAATVAAQFLGP